MHKFLRFTALLLVFLVLPFLTNAEPLNMLSVDTDHISLSSGGKQKLYLTIQGQNLPCAPFCIFGCVGGVSGTQPGMDLLPAMPFLPGPFIVPINHDVVTNFFIQHPNAGQPLKNFVGAIYEGDFPEILLPSVNFPAASDPGLTGIHVDMACVIFKVKGDFAPPEDPWLYPVAVSNPVALDLIP